MTSVRFQEKKKKSLKLCSEVRRGPEVPSRGLNINPKGQRSASRTDEETRLVKLLRKHVNF